MARPYDLKLLNALPQAEFHLLHVCRDHNFLPSLTNYPVHAFNWDARGAGNPSLAEGRDLVGERAVVGGLPHKEDLRSGSPATLAAEVQGMTVAMGKKSWMLGTGCTFMPDIPEGSLLAIRQAVHST